MRNPNANLRLELATQRGMQADDNTTVELRIEDRKSGEALAVIQMTADQWLNAMTGLSLNVEGFVTPFLDRVGKEMKHRSLDIPRDMITSYNQDEAAAQAREYASVYVSDGEQLEVRNTNHGWVAIFRSWS